jgi:hypothetical protein
MLEIAHERGISIDDAGEMESEELSLWAAHLARKRKFEDQQQDRRFLGLCVAMAAFLGGKVKFEPETFYPSIFEGSREPIITDQQQMFDALVAWSKSFSQASRS